MSLTAQDLRPVLQHHPAVVDQALEVLFPDPQAPVNLDGLRMLTEDNVDLADVLIAILTADAGEGVTQIESLRAFLNARGIELVPTAVDDRWDHTVPRLPDAQIPQPVPNDFAFDLLSAFAPRASAFRCRIQMDEADAGSGAFISKSLVLTAAHVVEARVIAEAHAHENGINDPDLPEISVIASDGKPYPARCIWYSPVHDDERVGDLPPVALADAHLDVAVLRVGLPLGLSYGYCSLPDPPVAWTGARLMTLIHYPSGDVRGFTKGRVLRQAETDLRLPHDIDTAGGSSGGLAFDHDLRFIGIHQGRWDKFRKLVPHAQFADAPGFLEAVNRDRPRRYLWSLEDDIDGQIIIGRRRFFEGLSHMLEHPATMLRGIWVRRLNLDETTGLSFSFDMLGAFLLNRARPSDPQTAHRAFRIPTALEDGDLLQSIAEQILGAEAALAHAGVRDGETSDVAKERDRAHNLAQALQRRAAETETTFWLFFETPPDGLLSEAVQDQFEPLIEWLVAHANLRTILAGFEQYRLQPLMFQQAVEAEHARRPGLLVDPLDRFTQEDIKITLAAMMADLTGNENPDPAVLQRMVGDVVRNLHVDGGFYPFAQMGRAVDLIRTRMKFEAGLV